MTPDVIAKRSTRSSRPSPHGPGHGTGAEHDLRLCSAERRPSAHLQRGRAGHNGMHLSTTSSRSCGPVAQDTECEGRAASEAGRAGVGGGRRADRARAGGGGSGGAGLCRNGGV
jgi:hypothetical protein